MNVYVLSENYVQYSNLINHLNWLNTVDFTSEDLTMMKLLKTWRRCKDLKFLKSEIIELVVQLSGNGYQSSKVRKQVII
jgi:hypothetical protein